MMPNSASTVQIALRPPISSEIRLDGVGALLVASFGFGTARLMIDDGPVQDLKLRAGAVCYVPAGRTVVLVPAKPVELLIVSFVGEHVDALRKRAAPGRAPADDTLIDWLDSGVSTLVHELRRAILSDRLTQAAYPEALADTILTRLLCHALGEIGSVTPRETISPGRLARILRHIDEHLDETIRVDALAGLAGLTRSHFSRAFQAITGNPPQRYILKRRISRARDLLSSGDLGIAEVAVRTGFSSQAHLSTAFAREVGVSPALYRASFQARD